MKTQSPLIHRFVFLFLLLSLSIPSVFALNSNEVKLSDPVGGNILPGGNNLSADNIKDSFAFSKIIPFVITYGIRLAVVLSVIALIFGGYQYLTAYGDEEKYKTAHKTIMYALLGLVLAITAFGLVKVITTFQLT